MSSKYDGTYLHVEGDPTYWAVDDGKLTKMNAIEEVYELGLRPLVKVEPAELEDLPIAGDYVRQQAPETAVLTFTDGIDTAEASAAGRALVERKNSK